MESLKHKRHGVTLALLIAGILVASSLVFALNYGAEDSLRTTTEEARVETRELPELRQPEESDHVRGDLDAPVTIIEFSDFECTFCGRLHPTLSRVLEENDDVAWVYRHFPLGSHSNSFSSAMASECMAKLGGNESFWKFADSAFENQRNLNKQFYENFASAAGIDAGQFSACLENDEIRENVQEDLNEVIAIGGRGTPHVVVVTPSGKFIPFSGALPYEHVSSIIEQARTN